MLGLHQILGDASTFSVIGLFTHLYLCKEVVFHFAKKYNFVSMGIL